jgi:hypothetical protein
MRLIDGTLARRLDFDELIPGRRAIRRPGTRPRLLNGPDKYKVLDLRRRRAQIAARRVLDLID